MTTFVLPVRALPLRPFEWIIARCRARLAAVVRLSERVPVDMPSRSAASDELMVAAVRRGDADAFLALYRMYYEPLCRYAYRYVHSRATAEDLVHDVFLRLWRNRGRWDVHTTVQSYLYAAIRGRALQHLERGRVEQRVLDATSAEQQCLHPCEPSATIEDVVLTADLAAAIQRVIDELPPRPRQVLLLRWQRHLTQPEIAAELGITLKTVELHMSRAFQALRAALPADFRIGDQ